MFTGAETPELHHSPPAMTTAMAPASTNTQKGWSVTDADLVVGFAVQVVLDSPFVSGLINQ